jgi:hypothetical protein
MDIQGKLALIEKFNNLSNAFDETIGLDKEGLLFRPFDDARSIIEQVVHCVDHRND